MANEENLKPFNKLTENEQRKIAQKGGKSFSKKKTRAKDLCGNGKSHAVRKNHQ